MSLKKQMAEAEKEAQEMSGEKLPRKLAWGDEEIYRVVGPTPCQQMNSADAARWKMAKAWANGAVVRLVKFAELDSALCLCEFLKPVNPRARAMMLKYEWLAPEGGLFISAQEFACVNGGGLGVCVVPKMQARLAVWMGRCDV